jgi:hypothetical protein
VDGDLTPEERRIRDVLAGVQPPASMRRYQRAPGVAPAPGPETGAGHGGGWRGRGLTVVVTVAVAGALVFGYLGLRGAGRGTVPGGIHPPARAYAAMAFDPDTRQVVMFGGVGVSGAPLDDTWLWSGSSWSQASPAQVPPAAIGAEMAWDPQSHRVLLAGGLGGSGCRLALTTGGPSGTPAYPSSTRGCDVLAGAWAWDGGDWAQVPLPAGIGSLSGASMATDPSTGRIVLVASQDTWTFAGSAFQPVSSASGTGSASQYAGEVWFPDPGLLFDYGLNSLTVAPSSPPSPVPSGSSPCADAAACPGQVPVTTAWEWTGSAWSPVTGTVQPLFAPPFGAMSSSVAPAAADLADGQVVTVDAAGNTLVSINPAAGWSLAAPASALGYRSGPAMAYDPATGTVVLFGGYLTAGSQAPQLSSATWSWDGEAWSSVAAGG